MKRFVRGRPALGWLVLALALFAVLGHVCVLPHEAHASGDEPPGHHDSHHDGPAPHDALHSASCEAVRSSVTPAAPIVAAAAMAVTVMPSGIERGAIPTVRPLAIAPSPPLFLLHSAFRI
jgi:hypothetical protein